MFVTVSSTAYSYRTKDAAENLANSFIKNEKNVSSLVNILLYQFSRYDPVNENKLLLSPKEYVSTVLNSILYELKLQNEQQLILNVGIL